MSDVRLGIACPLVCIMLWDGKVRQAQLQSLRRERDDVRMPEFPLATANRLSKLRPHLKALFGLWWLGASTSPSICPFLRISAVRKAFFRIRLTA